MGSSSSSAEPQSLPKPEDEDPTKLQTPPEDDDRLDVDSFKNYNDDQKILPYAMEDGYPQPSPPKNKKADIFVEEEMMEPDSHAHGVKPDGFAKMEDLVRDLTGRFSNDLHKVRAIFVWIGLQPFSMMRYPKKLSPKSPMGYLKRMALGSFSYAEIFTVMCRLAKVPCIMVSGVAKSSIYEIGDEDIDNLRNMWNAVYVAGGWRVVFPLWGLKAISGRSTGSWPGKDIHEKGDALKDMVLSTINEYYFLTDPNEFIYRCMPDENNWQLLKSPFTKQRFTTVPLLRPKFFEYGLKLQGSQDGILLTEDGVCEVRVSYTKGYVQLLPILLYYDREAEDDKLHIRMERYTAVINDGDIARFVLRLPRGGVYKLQILDVDNAWVCSFKIICVEPSTMGQFPVEAELGFGPYGNLKDMAGLEAKSHTKGMEVIPLGDEVEFVFARSRPMEFMTEIVHNDIWEEDLADCVSFKSDMGQLVVKVKLSIKGEFVLMIHAKDVGSTDDFDNVCNYLLIIKEPKKKKPGEEEKETVFSGMDKKVLKSLGLEKVVNKASVEDEAKRKEDMEKIQAELAKHNKQGKQEKRKKEIAHMKIALIQAIKGKDIDELERCIEDAKAYPELSTTVEEAEVRHSALARIRKYSSQVLSMSQSTISEIHRYTEPTSVIHDVMKATFLLLGESETNSGQWTYVQSLLRRTGKGSVIGRIKKFDVLSVELKTAKKVINLLKPYSKLEVTDASAGAGTFFIWATNIANDVVSTQGAK